MGVGREESAHVLVYLSGQMVHGFYRELYYTR